MARKGPTKQHYVPRAYLAEWCDPKCPPGQAPYVWVFDKKTRKGKRKAPSNILTQTDMYTLELDGGNKNYAIEETLSDIESKYVDIYRKKIKEHIPLDREEHIYLCAFVSVMLQRTMRMRENIEGFIDQLITVTEDMERAHNIEPTKSEEMKQYKKDAHKKTVISTMPDIAELLTKMNLAFLCTKGSARFITSDDPCDMFNPDLQFQGFYSPGLRQKNISLSIPLSPEILACFSWQEFRGYIWYSNEQIHEANRMQFGHSHQSVIANSRRFKKSWARKFPLDLFFIIKIIKHKAKTWFNKRKHKHGKR